MSAIATTITLIGVFVCVIIIYIAGHHDGRIDAAREQEKRKPEQFNIAVERLKTELSITKAKVVGAQHALKNDDIENALKWLKINEES